jgi:predicted SAM-dependent methyltransferase
MLEQSKSARRRYNDGNFITKYFNGHGVDIGAGSDPLAQYVRQFPLIKSARAWDMADGDAQYLETIEDGSLDWAHASHCLEHLNNPYIALSNWFKKIKSGGYLVFTVPDENMYENLKWPSQWTNEHLWSFTIYKKHSAMPKSINVADLIIKFNEIASCERITLIDDFYQPSLTSVDQTLSITTECAIEVIFKKS